MDNPIENAYLDQFGPENVDEFYFEHHVNFTQMVTRGWGTNTDPMSHADSVRRFLALRKRGIRAHSWP